MQTNAGTEQTMNVTEGFKHSRENNLFGKRESKSTMHNYMLVTPNK